MGIFLKLLATKHALFRFYGSYLREVIKTTKLMVVAVTHGDNSQLFSCRQKKARQKSWWSSPWLTATTQKKILSPEGRWQEKVEGCRRDSWRQPSILFFWLPPLKLIQNINIACFLAKTLKKIPIKKKLDYSTLLVQYVRKPRSTLTRKISKNFKPAPNGPRPTVRLGPLLVVRGV